MKFVKSELLLPRKLRKLPLHEKINMMLDYLVNKHHTEIIQPAKGKWDASHPDYNPDLIISEFNGARYLKYLTDDDSLETKKVLSRILTGLQRMKGSDKALTLILDILGVKGAVIDFFEVDRERRLNTHRWNAILKTGEEAKLKDCEVLVKIDIDENERIDAANQAKLKELVDVYLWTCAKIKHLVLVKSVSEFGIRPLFAESLVSTQIETQLPLEVPTRQVNDDSITHVTGVIGTTPPLAHTSRET